MTRPRARPARAPLPGRAAASLALVALACALALGSAVPARADGDPASDYLIVQSTFLSPFDGHIAPAQSARLIRLVAQAQQHGLALKVAVIVTPYDLGSVPILFDKPQTYAQFLSEEDFYYWKDELVVVMPDGYGLYKSTGTPAGDAAVIHKLAFVDTKSGTALVIAAQRAVRALAHSHGITLGTASATAKPRHSSSGADPIEIAATVGAVLLVGAAVYLGLRRWRAPAAR